MPESPELLGASRDRTGGVESRVTTQSEAHRSPHKCELSMGGSGLQRRARAMDLVRVAGLGAYVAALVVTLAHYGLPYDREQVLLWTLGLVLTLLIALQVRWREAARAVRDWLLLAALLLVYDYSRGLADWLGMPLQIESPIIVDRAMFPGDVPTVELQARLGPFLGERWWEAALSLVYVSHFFVPYIVTAVVWLFGRTLWRAWVTRFVGVTALGLLGYIIVPTMPPWLAAESGHLDGVELTTLSGWPLLRFSLAGELIQKGHLVVNHLAAFPSLHAAYPVLIAAFFWSRACSWITRLILVAYPLAMGFTLVIGGEHYVVDILGGWAVVAIVSVITYWNRRYQSPSGGGPEENPTPASETRSQEHATTANGDVALVSRVVED